MFLRETIYFSSFVMVDPLSLSAYRLSLFSRHFVSLLSKTQSPLLTSLSLISHLSSSLLLKSHFTLSLSLIFRSSHEPHHQRRQQLANDQPPASPSPFHASVGAVAPIRRFRTSLQPSLPLSLTKTKPPQHTSSK